MLAPAKSLQTDTGGGKHLLRQAGGLGVGRLLPIMFHNLISAYILSGK